MRFMEAKLSGAWLIEQKPTRDHRVFFARTFCAREFAQRGLETDFVQHSTSYSSDKGSLRGLHLQRAPHAEVKIVRCMKGAIWDVIVDLRQDSTTYRGWQVFKLTAENRSQLYVPAGFAHGFQTLRDDTVGILFPRTMFRLRHAAYAAMTRPLRLLGRCLPVLCQRWIKAGPTFPIHQPQASDVLATPGVALRPLAVFVGCRWMITTLRSIRISILQIERKERRKRRCVGIIDRPQRAMGGRPRRRQCRRPFPMRSIHRQLASGAESKNPRTSRRGPHKLSIKDDPTRGPKVRSRKTAAYSSW
jgi:dTDP-4-dehydrorhamnose 3,5-epimerase